MLRLAAVLVTLQQRWLFLRLLTVPRFQVSALRFPLYTLLSRLSSLHSPFYILFSCHSLLTAIRFQFRLLPQSHLQRRLSLERCAQQFSYIPSHFPSTYPSAPPLGTVHNPCENLKRFIYFLPLPFAVAIAAQHSDACSGAAAAAAPMSHRAAFPANALQQQILAYRH